VEAELAAARRYASADGFLCGSFEIWVCAAFYSECEANNRTGEHVGSTSPLKANSVNMNWFPLSRNNYRPTLKANLCGREANRETRRSDLKIPAYSANLGLHYSESI